jgi:prepilin-type N-terminal cleavage/methylation domain-containing protein
MRTSKKTQGGFTLIELTVSLALMAVVLTILLVGFRLTEGARRRGEEKMDAMTRHLAEIEAVHAQVSSAVPRMLTSNDEGRQQKFLSFRGSPKQLRFLSGYSWAGERNFGQWFAMFQVQAGSDGKEQLMVSEAGTPDDRQLLTALLAATAPATHAMPLGDPADRIELSYLEPGTPEKPGAWVPEWKAEEQKQLPRGVQVLWWQGKQEQVMTFVIPSFGELK